MRLVRAASGHNVCEIIDGSSSLACFLTDKKFHGARARGRPSPLVVVGMQSALLGCSPRQRSAQLSASARPAPSDARAIDVPFNFLALARDREREREKLGLGSIMHASQSRSRSCSFSLPPPPLAVLWLWWVWLWSSNRRRRLVASLAPRQIAASSDDKNLRPGSWTLDWTASLARRLQLLLISEGI